MILVKRRGELASLIVARLYAEGVPVAGVDRLRLNAPLGGAGSARRDPLRAPARRRSRLAALLVSPLIGWTQDELMAAAAARARQPVAASGATQPTSVWRRCAAILARADFATPYRLLEDMLSGAARRAAQAAAPARRGGARSDRGTARRGAGVRDDDDAVVPALPRLVRSRRRRDRARSVGAARRGAGDDRARREGAAGAARRSWPTRTVDPTRRPRSLLKWAPEPTARAIPVFAPRAAERGGPLDDGDRERGGARARGALAAVLRRRDPRRGTAGRSPARSARRARACRPRRAGMRRRRRRSMRWASRRRRGRAVSPATAPQSPVRRAKPRRASPSGGTLPAWARVPAPVEARPSRPLAPSALGEDEVADPPPDAAMRAAAERGRLLHALFERLPAGRARAPARRGRCAGWPASAASPTRDARARSSRRCCGIIDDPRFADLFGPDALAEAPIAATIDGGLVVSGTVDRLLVADDRVRVIDFKTGRRVPTTLERSRATICARWRPMSRRCAVIFPDRPVEAALLYTAGPGLFTLPPTICWRVQAGLCRHGAKLARRPLSPAPATLDMGPEGDSPWRPSNHRREFPGRRAQRRRPGAGRFLGRMVRAVQDDRAARWRRSPRSSASR